MARHVTPTTSQDNLQREAKRWLKALRTGDTDARRRLELALPDAPLDPTLRDVQHALAREYGFRGWTDLKTRVEAPPAVRRYHQVAEALVAAYAAPRRWAPCASCGSSSGTSGRGTPCGATCGWTSAGQRAGRGRRRDHAGGGTAARRARAQQEESWEALLAAVSTPTRTPMAAKAIGLLRHDPSRTSRARRAGATVDDEPLFSRDWDEVAEWLEDERLTGLHASGQMTDALLERFTRFGQLTVAGRRGIAGAHR